MTIYSDFASLADDLLSADNFGEVGTIRRTHMVEGSPSDPNAARTITLDYDARMAAFPVAQRDVDGTAIKAGDITVLVATDGLTITPTTTDQIVTSGYGVLSIVDAGEFAPIGTVTHYRMTARK